MSVIALLDSCRDKIAAQLSEDLAQTLKRVVAELTELVSKMPSQEMYSLYMDSMELARDKSSPITTSFKKHLFNRFNEEKRRQLNGSPTREQSNLDLSSLSLVEPDDLEESLAANTIANAIANSCGEELFGLGKRIGMLLNQADLKTEQIPLGPDVIGTALLDALKEQHTSVKIKLMLVSRINKHFPAKVRVAYQEINRYLVEHNILPTIRASMARSPSSAAAASIAAAAAQENATTNLIPGGSGGTMVAGSSGMDMFAMLQQLMFGRAGAGIALPGLPGLSPMQSLTGGQDIDAATGQAIGQTINPAVMQALTQLQHGRLDGLGMGGMNPEQITSGHINVLRELKKSQAAGMMGQMETMTLDIVVLVFDYILGDSRIPDAMKALIGRLQIPVLKVTMLDKAFFSQKTHPARQLLDLLADAALGWDPMEGHDSSLYQKVEQIVQRILSQYEDGLEIFTEALSEFQTYLAQEKQHSDQLTTRSAQFLRNREQFEIARVVAHDTILASLLDKPTPVSIRDFLLNHWEKRLAELHVAKGEASPVWQECVDTVNDLLWSLSPKTDKDERRKLIELLPRLLKRLDAGIDSLKLEKAVRDAFFSDLVKCHAIAVKAGFRGEQGETDATLFTAFSSEDLGNIPTQAVPIFGPKDFEDIPALTEAIIPDAALLQEIANAQEEASDLEEITISGVRGEAWDEPQDGHFELLVKDLKRGVWIEFKQDDDSVLRAKLAWISPLQGTYLFTNRLGQRAVSINANGLAAKFRDGRAQVINNVSLIDRAVNNVFEHFQKGG